MELQHIKRVIGAGWTLTVLVIGATVGMNSVEGIVLLLGCALVPSSLLLLWNHPPQTMSESIQRARR
jgi:hypothetical protein